MPLMRTRRKLVLGMTMAAAAAGAVALVLAISHVSSAAAPRLRAGTIQVNCPSPSLAGKLPAIVYLPRGYAHSSKRYPVIYFLHGLPADAYDYTGNAFVAQAVPATGRAAIVVAPQGSRGGDTDPEYLDWAPDKNWPDAIATDLPKCIDSRFRTLAKRTGRALIGVSAGGYGAFNIGLRHLDTFGALESWSGYFAATDPSGLATLDLGSRKANRRARVPRGRHLVKKLTRRPTFIAFYVGSQDATFRDANIMLDQAFTAHNIDHRFAVYPGAHDTSLWEQWAPLWLGYALNHLSRPRG
jgi:S-formylglutathione hydrolase FrmB